MIQRKYVRFMQLATAALTAAEAATSKGVLIDALSRLVQHSTGDIIETVIENYGINVQEGTDSAPEAGMARAYVDYIYNNGPKPEWLSHAGL